MYFVIDNISDCILWFVERFILIKTAANIRSVCFPPLHFA